MASKWTIIDYKKLKKQNPVIIKSLHNNYA